MLRSMPSRSSIDDCNSRRSHEGWRDRRLPSSVPLSGRVASRASNRVRVWAAAMEVASITLPSVGSSTLLPFQTRYNSHVMMPRLRKWRFPNWQPEFEAAIAETDVEKLKVKTAALDYAIFTRCRAIAGEPGYEVEREAIQLAIETLREIQNDKLGYPPWEQYFQKGTKPIWSSRVRSR